MRIFVAGATGAIGRELVPALASKGHQVTGLTRSPAKAETIRRMGGQPVVADALDAAAMMSALRAAEAEVVVHELTDLGALTDLRHFDRAFAVTNRLRTEGTDILLAAARAVGARLFVAQSFCGWTFSRTGGAIKTEADQLDPNPPSELRGTLEAIRYLERTVTASSQPEGIVLRYGSFYGEDTGTLAPAMVDQLRRRRMPIIGDGSGWWSFIHVADAAAATIAAIERGKPGQIYNVVDDEPAQMKDWLPTLAQIMGAKPPRHVPAWLGRLLAGEHMVAMMTQVRGGANDKARRELGWRPAYPSWREGFAQVLRQRAPKSAA
ncbi:NAD-dependent epimerase/dehydratase family protein [Bradyrhizobium sp. STM 3562]|uniref:NAD-dependent epimerase/dehydratase family protein n=1 Tax=Bradyrhizobium sp. STM 3562 TaxID=578924 RepID=UPI00388ECDF5